MNCCRRHFIGSVDRFRQLITTSRRNATFSTVRPSFPLPNHRIAASVITESRSNSLVYRHQSTDSSAEAAAPTTDTEKHDPIGADSIDTAEPFYDLDDDGNPVIPEDTKQSSAARDKFNPFEKKNLDPHELFIRRYYNCRNFRDSWETVYGYGDVRPWEQQADGGALKQALAQYYGDDAEEKRKLVEMAFVPGCGVAHHDIIVLTSYFPDTMALDLAAGPVMLLSEHVKAHYRKNDEKNASSLVVGDFFADEEWMSYFNYPGDAEDDESYVDDSNNSEENSTSASNKDSADNSNASESEQAAEREKVVDSLLLKEAKKLRPVLDDEESPSSPDDESPSSSSSDRDGAESQIVDDEEAKVESNDENKESVKEDNEEMPFMDTEEGPVQEKGKNGFDFIYDRHFFSYLPVRRRNEWGERMRQLLNPDHGVLLTLIDTKVSETAMGPPYKALLEDYKKVLEPNGMEIDGDVHSYDSRFDYCFWKPKPTYEGIREPENPEDDDEEEDLEWK